MGKKISKLTVQLNARISSENSGFRSNFTTSYRKISYTWEYTLGKDSFLH